MAEIQPQPKPTLLSLPPELQSLIVTSLPYPDLLSLKISHPYFHALLTSTNTPNVHHRIAWVLSRRKIYLPIPYDSKTNFLTDALFLGNPEVTRIIRRRRLHLECVQCKLARRMVWLKSLCQDEERLRRLCLVNEGAECPRLRELDERKAEAEKKLSRRLLRRLGWPSEYWEAGSSYWEDRNHGFIGPPTWVVTLTTWCALPGTHVVVVHIPTLIVDLVILVLLLLGLIAWGIGYFTLGGMWEGVVRSLRHWVDALWSDCVRELRFPV